MSTTITAREAFQASANDLAPWEGQSVRLKNTHGEYWLRGGTRAGDTLYLTPHPETASVLSFRSMLNIVRIWLSSDWIIEAAGPALSRTPVPTPGGSPSPSTACPPPPSTPQSIRSPDASPGTDGKGVRLLAVYLPAFDLLSGSADTCGVVLELAAFETPKGLRRTIVGWHGPFPTPPEAKDFAALLAAQPPTSPSDPSAAPAARNV